MRSFNNYTASDVSLVSPFDDRSVLRTYAHDDVSVGSWMIGLAVKHVNEAKLCCSSWPSGLYLSTLLYLLALLLIPFFVPFGTWYVDVALTILFFCQDCIVMNASLLFRPLVS